MLQHFLRICGELSHFISEVQLFIYQKQLCVSEQVTTDNRQHLSNDKSGKSLAN